jgi:hypothetical protein
LQSRDRCKILYEQKANFGERVKEKEAQVLDKIKEECPFKPQIDSRSRQMTRNRDSQDSTLYERLYGFRTVQQENIELLKKIYSDFEDEKLKQTCPFKPSLSQR